MAFIVIPTHNEEKTIIPLVTALRLKGHQVLVVDGGSVDNTVSSAMWADAIIDLYGTPNYRDQMLEGWRAALRMGADRIVQMDAGGSHNPDDLDKLLAVDADLVIGSRFMPGGSHKGNPIRSIQSRLAAFMLNFARHTHYTDWTSGYRVWKASALQKMNMEPHWWITHGHAWQIEVLFEAGERYISVKEAPIQYRASHSYMKLRDQFDAFGLWLRIFFTGPEYNQNGRRYQ